MKTYVPDKASWVKWGFLGKVRIGEHAPRAEHTAEEQRARSQLRFAVLTDQGNSRLNCMYEEHCDESEYAII